MPRKGWNTLSPAYRTRLEKNGISKSDYDKGASIQSARGHSKTPERPSQAQNFPTYKAQQLSLIQTVVAKKQHFFGTSPKWNPLRAARIFVRKPPSMAVLKRWASLSKEEWLDAIRQEPDAAAYLGYH